ncbi:MAG TPA: HAMP domain-containing sensor histidine kinase, partial [Acidimicrobiales bacterium]|nr:HAMP domain-containing sensor histidine kinase [Acidimicrobiales bacterium]
MPARLSRFRPRRLGLRARITLTFALGALALSLVLAGTTYLVARQTLVRQREASVLRQTYVNARVVHDSLRSASPDIITVITSLQTPARSFPLVLYGDRWFPATLEYGRDAVPAALRERVAEGHAARMRYTLYGTTVLAVGIPLRDIQPSSSYFEIVSLGELQNTLRSIRLSLLGAALLTTLLGALLGVWASRRAVRPLAQAATAAQAIAGGNLDTRLEVTDDRDLALLTTSFNEMAAALQGRIQRDARFASDVSHELRSPLMTLSASIEVLQSRRDEMPARAQAALDLLVADVARFQNLVEDLLEISRVDAGSARLNLEEVMVAELVPNAVEAASPDRRIPVSVTADVEGDTVRADKRRMVRVLANLIDNARVHGGGASLVSVEHVKGNGNGHGDTVQIAVEDSGPGVPSEERTLIFERFARGANSGRRGMGDGVGLGLALVDEHVRLHGGRVWVD